MQFSARKRGLQPFLLIILLLFSPQIWATDASNYKHKLSAYFSTVWNRFDCITHGLFVVSVILRFTVPDRSFEWPRMFYCVTLSLYFIRFMQAFDAYKAIGPKVIMIRQMVGH